MYPGFGKSIRNLEQNISDEFTKLCKVGFSTLRKN